MADLCLSFYAEVRSKYISQLQTNYTISVRSSEIKLTDTNIPNLGQGNPTLRHITRQTERCLSVFIWRADCVVRPAAVSKYWPVTGQLSRPPARLAIRYLLSANKPTVSRRQLRRWMDSLLTQSVRRPLNNPRRPSLPYTPEIDCDDGGRALIRRTSAPGRSRCCSDGN